MGPEQVLRAAARALAALAIAASTAAAAPATERVAVLDLGPDPSDATARRALAVALRAGGFEPVTGDGIDDALAGIAAGGDAVALATALTSAEHAFGALDCAAATAASAEVIGIASAREAAGLPAPELLRAYSYELLCADRASDVDGAMAAARQLRALGGTGLIPPALAAAYPDVDLLSNRDVLDVEIRADVAGAEIWVDHRKVGASPARVALAAGAHVIAAATADGRRGWAAGTAVRAQPVIAVATRDQTGAWSGLARRVAGWRGERPAPDEIAAVLALAHARLAILRRGDAIEAWGRAGAIEAPQPIGGVGALRHLAAASELVSVIAQRVQAWADHAPDPDRPLLVETPEERADSRRGIRALPTQWWVYATIAGVLGTGLAIVLVHDHQSDTQRVELHYP